MKEMISALFDQILLDMENLLDTYAEILDLKFENLLQIFPPYTTTKKILTEAEALAATKLEERLIKYTNKIAEELKKLATTITAQKAYSKDEIEQTNEKIVNFVDKMIQVNTQYQELFYKGEATNKLQQAHKKYIANLQTLHIAIVTYNERFDYKILDFPQAKSIIAKRKTESLDNLIEEIEALPRKTFKEVLQEIEQESYKSSY